MRLNHVPGRPSSARTNHRRGRRTRTNSIRRPPTPTRAELRPCGEEVASTECNRGKPGSSSQERPHAIHAAGGEGTADGRHASRSPSMNARHPERDDSANEMNESQVVVVALLPPDEQTAISFHPAVSTLHWPAMRLPPSRRSLPLQGGVASLSNVALVPTTPRQLVHLRVVATLVQAEMLTPLLSGSPPPRLASIPRLFSLRCCCPWFGD